MCFLADEIGINKHLICHWTLYDVEKLVEDLEALGACDDTDGNCMFSSYLDHLEIKLVWSLVRDILSVIFYIMNILITSISCVINLYHNNNHSPTAHCIIL